MINFESRLKKLKHLVLKEVILSAKIGQITKEVLEKIPYKIIFADKAEYRCCVYKERAIVYERAQLAAGFLPDNNILHPLADIKNEKQILYVISAACDSCPIERFKVTEACRGCLQNKCIEACSFNAISIVNGRALINHELCRECGMCERNCPYNAIAEVLRPCKKACPTGALDIDAENEKAIINNSKCIQCGACMEVCPFGAITDKSDVVSIVNVLNSGKKVHAVAAPSIAGQFGDNVTLNQVNAALKQIGFYNMEEAAIGADITAIEEADEFIDRMQNGERYMTTSCCPCFVSYIENSFPKERKSISNTESPMIAAAKKLKEYNSDIAVVFIGPCTGKKNEINRNNLKGVVDYVMTFEELRAMFDAYDIKLENTEPCQVKGASVYGVGFAQSGGVAAAVNECLQEKGSIQQLKSISVSGKDSIKNAMLMAGKGKLYENFIEGMMCDGGCIGGPATCISAKKAKQELIKYIKQSTKNTIVSADK